MGFDTSSIKLSDEQLRIIDEAFSKMGLLYNLSIMPCNLSDSGWPRSDDVFMLHGFIYHIVRGIMQYIDRAELDISDEDKETLKQNIESAALGRIMESIIVLHHIKKIESSNELTVCGKSYSNGAFITERKCTKPHLYKYNNTIAINGKPVIAEIDLVISEPDTIRLIEIKKSTVIDENQTRWLNNETVIDDIRNKISWRKRIVKEVYYMGEPLQAGDIAYKNIPAELLKI